MSIIWSPEAAADLETAIEFIAERNPSAAAKIADGILALIERLAEEPILGPEHELSNGEIVRGWPYPPFRIYYQLTDDTLRLIRIYHQKRSPIVR